MNAEIWFMQLEMIENVKRQIRAKMLEEAAEEQRIRQEGKNRAWICGLVYEISKNTNSLKGGNNENGIQTNILFDRRRAR